MDLLLQATWPLSLAFAGLWALRLWRTTLYRRYLWLFLFLFIEAVQGAVSMFLYYSGVQIGGRSAYQIWWPLSQPIMWILVFGVIFEIFDRLLDGYRGLQKLGRMVVYGTLGLVGGFVILTLILDAFAVADLNLWKSFWLKQEQSVILFTAGSLFLLFLFQKFFHATANPNVRLLFLVFGLHYALEAILVVLRNYIGRDFRDVRDLIATSVYAACMAIGWLWFSPEAETEAASAGLGNRTRDELSGAAGAAARRMKSVNDQLETILRTRSPGAA